MKIIKFKSIKLLNFCGIREANYEFGEYITTFSGTNGIGKSTIAKAATYVLFGTDLRGNALDIKTYDANHEIIPEIPHEAELAIAVDDKEIILKRTLNDSWKDKQVKNIYKYYVNGEVATATDYKKAVASICDENLFRLLSSPQTFLSMPWADQRQRLEALTDGVSERDITGGDKKFDVILKAIEQQPVEAHIKHLKFRRSEVQKLLDEVPSRLGELQKAMPEKQDWDSIRKEYDELKKQESLLLEQISSAKNGGADMIRKNGLRQSLELEYKRKDNMERSARVKAANLSKKHESDMLNAQRAHRNATAHLQELMSRMDGYTDTEVNVKKQIEEYKAEVKEFNKANAEVKARTWEWDAQNSYCPHCGQLLPQDDLGILKQESEKKFNETKANDLKKLQEDFAALKHEYNEAKELLKQLDEDRQRTLAEIKAARQIAENSEVNLNNVQIEEVPTMEALLSQKPEYQDAKRRIEDLESELNKSSDSEEVNNEVLAELASQMQSVKNKALELSAQLSEQVFYDRISIQIEDVQKDKKKYQQQIDELDEQIDVASEYYQKSCTILEDKINNHFSFVKWSLFKTNLKGEQQPFCECYHNGVPYSVLNTADQVNAGIDIAYTFAKHYNVSVPIILDNCESNLHPLCDAIGQQIRFQVTPDGEMKVATETSF